MPIRLLFIATLLTVSSPPQHPEPQTFRSSVQIVEVDVRVMKDGQFVTDLTPADFRIAEDGVPQQIQSVVLVNGSAPTDSRVVRVTEAPGPAPALHPSIWIFVFDTSHMTPGPLQRAREAVVAFIAGRFRDGDIGGIIAGGQLANNHLTRDLETLKKAAASVTIPGDLKSRQLDARAWPRLQDEREAHRIVNGDREAVRTAVARACAEDADACRRGTADMEVLQKARQMTDAYRVATMQTLGAVSALSGGLAKIPGAKTVVFLSEGFVTEGMDAALRQAAGQASRAGARFYSIDVRGLSKGPGSHIIDQPHASNPMGASGSFDAQADGTSSLAVDTGGFAIRNENDFGRALDAIQRDAGTYFVVSYTPANPDFDGNYRAISVNVSRPGVTVRARRGYLALTPAALLGPTAASGAATPVTPSASPANQPVPDAPEPLRARPLIERTTSAADVMAALGRDEGVARMKPGGDSTLADRGWTSYSQGDLETAVEELGGAARLADARPWVSYALGLAQFALQRPREAAQAWERVRREVPEFEPVYFGLADAYTLQKEDGAALRVLRDAEVRWPADPEVANAIGVIHVRRGSLDAAIQSFERATAAAPSEALGFFNLARALQMRLLKSQRYDPQSEKWIGGEDDRRRAVAGFEKYLAIGGPYERQAREAIARLGWK